MAPVPIARVSRSCLRTHDVDPVWKEAFAAWNYLERIAGLVVEVWNYRRLFFDDFMGSFEILRDNMDGQITTYSLLNKRFKVPSKSDKIKGLISIQVSAL